MAITNLRCYGKKSGDLYVATCIDLCLSAQGSSLEDATDKLHAQIASYIHEATTIDRDHYDELMNRKSPMSVMIEYHIIRVIVKALSFSIAIKNKAKTHGEHLSVFSEEMHPRECA